MNMTDSTQDRINRQIEQVKNEFSKSIVELLKEVNKQHLKGKGNVAPQPIIDRTNLRWTLAWKVGKISYDLNIVANVEDDGKQARISKVWVHRHASTDYDFDGHTPTTRMRRLTGLSLAEIKEAIEAELK